ncbi:hypothetical protein Tco_0604727 [Tanacetum coccineum]
MMRVMFIEIIRDDDEPQNEGPNEGEGTTTEEPVVEYFDTFPTRDELTYYSVYRNRPTLTLTLPLIYHDPNDVNWIYEEGKT